jgi:hypothetical protein
MAMVRSSSEPQFGGLGWPSQGINEAEAIVKLLRLGLGRSRVMMKIVAVAMETFVVWRHAETFVCLFCVVVVVVVVVFFFFFFFFFVFVFFFFFVLISFTVKL